LVVPVPLTPNPPHNPKPNSDVLELITRNQRALYGYIYSLVGRRDQADEILQETNLALCRKIHEFDGRVQFTTWACRVAYFEVLAKRKKTKREKVTFLDDSLLDAVASQTLAMAKEEADLLPQMRDCMKELPPHSRAIIERRYEPGGSVMAIAQDAGRSVGSIRVTLHRIRMSLLDCIQRKADAQS